jgi:HD-GYP domain-containing protein (c-di-GMP phosphodiesterase class II)
MSILLLVEFVPPYIRKGRFARARIAAAPDCPSLAFPVALDAASEYRTSIMSDEYGGLEELEEEEREPPEEGAWSHPCVVRARRGLERARTPAVLMDRRLRILWTNTAFPSSFGTERRAEGESILLFFLGSLEEKERRALMQSVSSVEAGFCWCGRIEKQIQNQLSVIASLVILPLFGDNRKPVAYQGIFSDISAEYRQMLKTTYSSLLQAARLKDNDTGNHIERVNRYSRTLAGKLLDNPSYSEVDVEFVENIGFLAAMHDVGKIGTPDDILNKAGKLESWEWEIMKEHTINGAYIMANYPNPMGKEIALRHHERWDGSGYPHGLGEKLIPLSARIVAIADVYDALRMKRSYKEAMGHEEARALILEQRGRHFEPFLVDCFKRVEETFREIFEELKEEEST